MTKPKAAFVCVHNSCRQNQIAEALKYLSSNILRVILQAQKQNHKSIRCSPS